MGSRRVAGVMQRVGHPFIVVSMLVMLGLATSTSAQDRSPLTLRDASGKEHRLLPCPANSLTVVFFITTVCPITNSYQPTWRALREAFASKGVRFFQVAVGDESAEALREHGRLHGLAHQHLIDDGRGAAKTLGARNTGHVVVLDEDQRVRYAGRIDDRWADRTRKRPLRRHDLRDALESLLRGEEPHTPRTKSFG